MDFLDFVSALDREPGIAVPETDYPQPATLNGCLEYLSSRQTAHQRS